MRATEFIRFILRMAISVLVGSCLGLLSISAHAATDSEEKPTELNEVVVEGRLDKARDSIVPSLGATEYNINQD